MTNKYMNARHFFFPPWKVTPLLFFMGLALPLFLSAQEVAFTLDAPKVVSQGERFRITYTVNEQGADFNPGKLDGIRILSGPNPSQSTSIQIINGKREMSFELSYGYVAEANEIGKFTIGPGTITVEGKSYKTNTREIEVIKGQPRSQGQSGNNNSGQVTISDDDVFMRLLLSKRNVKQGEPIIATLKLYSKVSLANLTNFRAPEFNGFWTETLKEAKNLSFERESVNGTIYQTAILQQNVLIPERAGKLTIEPTELSAIVQVRVQSRRRSFFDSPFGSYRNIEKDLKTPEIKVNVSPLPGGAPAGFTGAIGNIDFSATVDLDSTSTNEPVSLKITYSGTGNLKLISPPKINFPTDFEVYDPKINSNYSASSKGFSGTKSIEYLMIPRHSGDFEIPAIPFAVYDLESGQYQEKVAGPFKIHVKKGAGGDDMVNLDLRGVKEDVEELGSDIRYIKTNAITLRQKDRPFFGSVTFFLSYLIGIAVCLLVLFFTRRQRKQNADVVQVKNRKAGKVAKLRLKKAKTHLDAHERDAFYKEILEAQWGYLSDKLNIPKGELNKELVKTKLNQKSVNDVLILQWETMMDRCEFAQFAPSDGDGELQQVYQEAQSIIEKMEGQLKG